MKTKQNNYISYIFQEDDGTDAIQRVKAYLLIPIVTILFIFQV